MDIIEITKKMKISDFYKNDTVFVLLLIMSAIAFQAGCTTLSANNGQVPPGTKKIVETRYYEPIKQGNDWVCGVEKATSYAYPHSIVYFDEYGNAVLEEIINDEGEVYITTKWDYYDAKMGKLQKEEKHYKYIDGKEIEIYIRDDEGKLLRLEKTGFKIKQVESFEYDNQGRLLKVLEGGKTTRMGYSPENSLTEISYEEVYDENCKYSYKGKYGLVKTKIIIRDKQTKAILKQSEEFYKDGDLVGKNEVECLYNNMKECIFEMHTHWLRGGKYYVTAGMSKADLQLEKAGYVSWRYNEYGDDIEYESGTFDEYGIAKPTWRKFYERIYNEKGNCIKCTEFWEDMIGGRKIEAKSIEIRTITYL